ncbi:hepatoma-derived growth factor-related protein 2 [Brachypodium distachyon]|uniref:Glabrous enhancer-binding protein-like DBD domain-containing protein n=1 Tax=Brachypodium distachyon TaxID=15368 RepID=I1I2T6_BRADI|nr:hepatoma-derived growth factor-related protein 2 [Brachypodium distachyon]KQJ96045.1 hypothetical protein BRADI_3g20610v3 [Brachypodium distachyon]|eukprot:XP_003571636.1 hepatoma-derived growth factor-related protein 2 [Brachypodium distachyon]
MARKRRAPSPPPPPPPPQEESSSEETSSGEEEEVEPTPTRATQKPHEIPKSPPTATAADATAEGSDDESSDSEIDAEAFQLRQVVTSPSKPPAAASKLESDADEEQGEPSDKPEPLGKKKEMKPKAPSARKRQATESTPSGKSKKAKAEVEKAVPEPAPPPKAKKAKAGAENTKKAVPDPSPSSKSEKLKRWTLADEIKILEAFIGYVKTNGTQPGALDLIAAVGDTLDRKNCSKVEMYEKVRNLRQRYEKAVSTGTLPVKDDDLRKFKLSEVAWGANAKEVASASISQNDGAKGKKTQTTKEKIEGDTKGRSSKSKKQGKHIEELEDNETTDPQIGGTLVRSKREKSDKKMGGDVDSLGPKEATEEMDTAANVKRIRKGFDELQNLYPNLSTYVESIKAQHPCGETLKRAFELIDDEKACTLESKIKKQRVAEVKTEIRRADTKKEVANMLLG